MMNSRLIVTAAFLSLGAIAGAACRSAAAATQVAQPPGPPAPTVSLPKYTPADASFMQGMIGHHQQALEMVALLKTHTTNRNMQLLGLRIEVSQNDEIKMMQTWLRNRGEAVPDEHAMHVHDAKLMPGMLSPEQMSQLAASKDAAFDRLFLEFMIQHHNGALIMVKELASTPGAGQESSVNAFAAEVEADQGAEITRMRAMRAAMGRH
jgi:uncharacterized protein (DUF305 family)